MGKVADTAAMYKLLKIRIERKKTEKKKSLSEL
jgi:hypothetical protein